MTKNSKSNATIRRRKNKPTADFLSKLRKSHPNKPDLAGATQEENEEEVFFYKEVLQSSVIEKIMSSDKTIFLGLLVIRLVNAMLIQTWFVPDEFWQSVEVAHKMIFDYGYLTWEWKVGIRSYAYPLLFATLYKLLEVVGLDNRLLMIRGPRLLQGVFASVGDLYLFFLSRRLAGRDVAKWTLLCQLLSWFTGYCCTRTLSNSMETVLVTAALYYFPWPGHVQPKGYARRFVLLAASSVVVRPTAAVMWVLLCSWHLQQSKGEALWSVLRTYITTGLTVLGISTVIDHVWYGEWILVHLKFLQFNVLSGGSAFYGRHPWHWYLTQGLPVVLGAHVLPFVVGAWRSKNKVLLMLLVWKVFVLSFLAHKEFRFLLPVLPLAMHYCGVYFHSITKPPPPPQKKNSSQDKSSKTLGKGDSGSETTSTNKAVTEEPTAEMEKSSATVECNGMEKMVEEREGKEKTSSKEKGDATDLTDKEEVGKEEKLGDAIQKGEGDVAESKTGAETAKETLKSSEKEEDVAHRRRARKVRFLVLLLATFNILPLLYFSLIHQRGTIDVMNYLHEAITKSSRSLQHAANSTEILYLMPCHSTPYYSSLHSNVSLRFLTCEPNLNHTANYTDEADVFYQAPGKWLKEQYQNSERQLPTHVVYFNVLLGRIAEFLRLGGYTQCAKFFHTHVPEGRVGSHVLVSCRYM